MPAKSTNSFTVETIRPEAHGSTVTVHTVVLAPASGNTVFGKNPVARIEIARLTQEQAEAFKVGEDVEVEIKR